MLGAAGEILLAAVLKERAGLAVAVLVELLELQIQAAALVGTTLLAVPVLSF